MTEHQIQKVIQDIKDLKIQGNTNIAKTVAKTLLDYVTHAKVEEFGLFISDVKSHAEKLANARPNEPMTLNAVSFITKDIENLENQQQVRIKVIERIENFFKYVDESYEIIRTNGVDLLKNHKIFYTHCHSSLARDVLIRISKINPDILVINDETRPLYQGRITATKLALEGVKILHTIDSAASSVFFGDILKPEAVIVGCDGISVEGDLINKIGTLNIALAAKEANVPFYVVTQTMKIDLRSITGDMRIEQRNKDEVWKDRPNGVDILNPAFDLVPAKYITGGYITEKGLLRPEEFRQLTINN
jgi:ribose 1,5-bisphosphate isomerase